MIVMTETTFHWLQLAAVLIGAIVGVCVVLGIYEIGVRKGWWW